MIFISTYPKFKIRLLTVNQCDDLIPNAQQYNIAEQEDRSCTNVSQFVNLLYTVWFVSCSIDKNLKGTRKIKIILFLLYIYF